MSGCPFDKHQWVTFSSSLLSWVRYRKKCHWGWERGGRSSVHLYVLWLDRKKYWKRKIEVFLNSLIIYLMFEALNGSRKGHPWATVLLEWVPFQLKELTRHRPTLRAMFEAGLFSPQAGFALPLFFISSDENYFPFQGCDGQRLCGAEVPIPGETLTRPWTLVLLQTGQYGAIFLLQEHSRYLAQVFGMFPLKGLQ